MRLIDADKIDFSEVFIGNSDFARDTREAAQDLINRQPTAYDIDEVCKELESRADDLQKQWQETYDEGCGGAAEAYYRAIEIVRNGGKKQ